MKLKSHFLIAATIVIAASLFNSCKKDNSPATPADTTVEAQSQSSDQTLYTNESDAVTDDVNAALDTDGGSFNGRVYGTATPPISFVLACDVAVAVDTMSTPHTITLTYSGNNCNSTRRRSGTVTVAFSSNFKWAAAGARLTVTFNNLKITRLSDNKSIVINGVRTITNVSGGLLRNLASLDSIVQTVNDANMSVTFDNTAQRTWQNSIKRVFTYNNGIVVSFTGSSNGVNRFGHNFNSTITQPLVVAQSCNFRYTSGQVQSTGSLVTTTTTFGLDSSGNAVSDCPAVLYYKIVWTGALGNSLSYTGSY